MRRVAQRSGDARGGPGRQVRTGVPQARPPARDAATRAGECRRPRSRASSGGAGRGRRPAVPASRSTDNHWPAGRRTAPIRWPSASAA